MTLTPSRPAAQRIGFGSFAVDFRIRELRKRGAKVKLPDQPFLVLELLLERPGDVVTREELQKRLWPGDTFVEFDLSLNSAVRKLREALGDSADHPTFIETLPRRGYRFIAEVTSIEAASRSQADTPGVDVSSKPSRLRRVAAGVAAAAVLILIAAAWRARSEPLALQPIRSIAVLPFENLTGDPGRGHFVDAMTDGVITELARLGGVRVVSATSSKQYKDTAKRLPEIARELEVDAIVEGSVGGRGQELQMTAQLVHAVTDGHVWASRYERDVNDVLPLQVEIARAIARAIANSQKGTADQTLDATLVSPEAYKFYLRGLAATGKLNQEAHRLAVSYFEQALAVQPDFARAHASLALVRLQFLFTGPMAPAEILPAVEDAARRAIALDDALVDAHYALAVSLATRGDFAGSDVELERVRALEPERALWPSQGLIGLPQDQLEDGVVAAERARDLDPLSINTRVNLARVLRAAGYRDRAIAELHEALKIEPNRPNVLFQLGATFVTTGDLNAGIAELEKAVAQTGQRNPRFLAYLGYAYAMVGRTGESRAILSELVARRERHYVSSFGIALIYDALGDQTAARAALRRASHENALEFTQLEHYPRFPTLLSEPRYQEAVHRSRGRR